MEFLMRRDLAIIIVLLCIFSPYVRNSYAVTPEGNQDTDVEIKSIAVIPFSTKPGISIYEPGAIVTPRERFLTLSLYEALLTEVTTVRILPIRASDNEYVEIQTETPGSHYRNTAIDVGKSLGADAVLVGVISEYRERKGGDYGADAPASVAFSIQLYSTEGAKLLWESYFSETQRALTDNVFEIKKFFKRGAKWITVDELAKEGARTAAMRLNKYLLEN
jgi:hypothetical protein